MQIAIALIVVALVVLMLVMRSKPDISGPEAHKVVADGGQLVDVRTPGEYAAGHIDGASNIPLDRLLSRLAEIDKDKPVVLYCRSGARSAQAAAVLKENGYDPVFNLGGMSAW